MKLSRRETGGKYRDKMRKAREMREREREREMREREGERERDNEFN